MTVAEEKLGRLAIKLVGQACQAGDQPPRLAHQVCELVQPFTIDERIGIRIRRIALASVAPGAVIDGPPIFNADLGNEIDNMEGIDSYVTPEGETVLTMVSDDNFSMIQRTLLLQFTLVE